MRDGTKRLIRILGGTLLGVAVLVLLARAVDPAAVWRNLAQANIELLAVAFAVTAIHYVLVGYRFASFFELFSDDVPTPVLVRTGILASALGRAIGFAGLAGASVRLAVIKRWGGRGRDVIAASIVNHAFKLTLVLVLALGGLLYTFGFPSVHALPLPGSLFGLGGVVLVSIMVGLWIFVVLARAKVPILVERTWEALSSGRHGEQVRGLHATVIAGVDTMRDHPDRLYNPSLLLAGEVLLLVGVLYLCFLSLGTPVAPGILLVGYAVGTLSRSLSIVPGGLGIQEGSIAGALVLMGVGWEVGLAGVVLFRIVTDWLPGMASLPLGWELWTSGADEDASRA